MTKSTPRPPRDLETRAAALIKAALPRVQVQQHDPGGGPVQTYDFDLLHDNGTVEALEVTEATDKSLRDAQGARAAKVPDAVLPAPGLRRSWHLYPTTRTRFASLTGCVPLLAQLEQAGVGRFSADLDAGPSGAGPVAVLASRFGLNAGVAWSETTDPKLVVALPNNLDLRVEQPNDPGRSVVEAVEIEAHKPDNIAKLERSGATERHLLVWVDVDNALPWQDLDRGQLPVALPSLPAAVTTVWVATTGSHGKPILWRARPPEAWEPVLA
jgi:hypothetical protein